LNHRRTRHRFIAVVVYWVCPENQVVKLPSAFGRFLIRKNYGSSTTWKPKPAEAGWLSLNWCREYKL